MSIDVRHDPDGHRFVAEVDGYEAYLAYGLLDDRRVDFRSTFSPPELRGRGVAGEIVAKALEWARDEGLTVIPSCSYVAKYLEKESSR